MHPTGGTSSIDHPDASRVFTILTPVLPLNLRIENLAYIATTNKHRVHLPGIKTLLANNTMDATTNTENATIGVEKRLQQHSDMPAEVRLLSDSGREQFAFRLMELSCKARDVDVQKGYQDLRRCYNEIDEKSLTLKRKRMDDVIYCYSAIEELGISLDADARVHILDTDNSHQEPQ